MNRKNSELLFCLTPWFSVGDAPVSHLVVERLAVGAVDGDGVGVVLVDGSVPEGGKQ